MLIRTFYFRKSKWIQEDFSSFSLCKEAKLAAEYKKIYKLVNLKLYKLIIRKFLWAHGTKRASDPHCMWGYRCYCRVFGVGGGKIASGGRFWKGVLGSGGTKNLGKNIGSKRLKMGFFHGTISFFKLLTLAQNGRWCVWSFLNRLLGCF